MKNLFFYLLLTENLVFRANAFFSQSLISPSARIKTNLHAATSRLKRVSSLQDWAKQVEINTGAGLSIDQSKFGGLGLISTKEIAKDALLLTVPSDVALSVESPGDGPSERAVLDLVIDRRALRSTPWYVQFSLYFHYLDKVNSKRGSGADMRSWLDALPKSFETPIHWTDDVKKELQYDHLVDSVARQASKWESFYETIRASASEELKGFTFDDFVWGCELARSRAFSGAFTGSAFNPFTYAFTFLLVCAYVGFGLGDLDQAANGAGLVFAAQVFQDFVLPKLFSKKRYVVCPVIDMANHNSIRKSGEVSFEFFGDAYSLATSNSVQKGEELFISYGERSNDQLLQYYGFIEKDNPNDVYIMPPLREWNIDELEKACGRRISSGRLEKLDRAGLLGTSSSDKDEDSDDYDTIANPKGGVVVTRASGVDLAVIQALRALFSSDDEWEQAGEAIGNFAAEFSPENERIAKLVAKSAIELELASKETTLEEDVEILKRMSASKSLDASPEEELAIMFRIEKKKLLQETVRKLEA